MMGRSKAAVAKPPLPVLPLGALAAGVAAIGVIVLQASASVAHLLLYLALAFIGAEVLRRIAGELRRGRIVAIAVAGLAVAIGVGFALVVREVLTPIYGLAVLLVEAGILLVLSGWEQARRASATTPWQRLSDTRSAWRRPATAMLLMGVLLILVAIYMAGRGWAALRAELPIRATIAGLSTMVVIAGAATGALLWRSAQRGKSAGGDDAAPRHADDVAAHLHDSVLQTLALIGRSADDPSRVAQLARQQERSLRAWLAGRDESQADSLGAAIQAVARDVEDEHAGAIIEVVAVGDAALDSGASAMVFAAREAMRNAVRHAGSPVRVFVEVDGAVREVFVRDAGPGFALSEVADERRGVRDAIIGRMERVGGTAMIDSGPAGTEVSLRHDVSRGGAAQ